MTSGGTPQGWPGQPDPGQGHPQGSWPQSGQQPASPGWQQQAPQYGQPAPGQYGQPAPGQYGQPAPGQYGQPAPGLPYPPYQQQQPSGPGTAQQHPPQPGYGAGPQGPMGQPSAPTGKRKSNLPVVITVIAVVVALAAAGLVYLLARKGSNAAEGGQSTPKEAVVSLLNSVTKQDPIGLANQLDPTEAHLFADMSGSVLDQLKRLGVINADVQADKVTGMAITTKDLTYASSPLTINDHLQIVELTGGTITLQTGGGTSPYTQKMIDAFPELKQVSAPQTRTIDITKEVKDAGHPFRIATVDRDGKWYPSVFYTIADNWAFSQHGAGYKLDPIGNDGGATPEAAMNTLVQALTTSNAKELISVLSPDEMGVLHDYGNLMIGADSQLGDTGLGGAKLSNMAWSVSDVTGGKKVSVKSLTITTADGKIAIERDPAAGSLKVSMPGQGTINVNADNIDTWLAQFAGSAAADQIPPQVRDIIKREFGKVIGLGVVMVQAGDGKWYVSPLRTFSDVLTSLLSGLQPGDIDYFMSLAGK